MTRLRAADIAAGYENKKIIEDKKKLHYIQEEIHKNIEEVLLKNKTHKNY